MWALRITIARAILGTRIPMALGTSILLHRHKIQGTIEATVNLTVIYSESELTVLQAEHLVLVFAARIEHVQTRPNVGSVWSLCDKLQGQRVAISRRTDTIRVVVLLVSTLNF